MVFTADQLRNIANLMDKHGASNFGAAISIWGTFDLGTTTKFGIELPNGDIALVEDSDLTADPATSVVMHLEPDGSIKNYIP